jgi:hypothetical protein
VFPIVVTDRLISHSGSSIPYSFQGAAGSKSKISMFDSGGSCHLGIGSSTQHCSVVGDLIAGVALVVASAAYSLSVYCGLGLLSCQRG